MNEYEDLFKKFDKNRNLNPTPKPVIDPNEEMQKNIIEQRINRIIFISYYIVAILVTIASYIIFNSRFPDESAITANLTVETTLDMTVYDSEDVSYPYRVFMTGSIRNDNDFELPCIYVTYNIYDSDGRLILSEYINQEYVAPADTFTYEKSVSSQFEPSTYTVTYGFDESSFFYIIIYLVQMTVCTALFIYVDKTGFFADFKRFFANFWHSLALVIGGVILLILTMYLAQIILNSVFHVYTTSDNEMSIQSMFSPNPFRLVLLFLILCVLTPIVEELTFRKALYGFFYHRFGPAVAIFASSIVFGLMHVISYGDFVQAIVYVPMGAIIGTFYYFSQRNVHVTIGIHFINNFISFLLYALSAYGFSLFVF